MEIIETIITLSVTCLPPSPSNPKENLWPESHVPGVKGVHAEVNPNKNIRNNISLCFVCPYAKYLKRINGRLVGSSYLAHSQAELHPFFL